MAAAHRHPAALGPAAAGWPALSRVLICDDRRDVRGVLTDLVRALPGAPDVDVVGDGPAAVSAYATAPADLVLIGVHRGTVAGTGALRLLLDRDPMVTVIVYGPVADAELLTAAVRRGARGLLVWDLAAPLRHLAVPRTVPAPGGGIGIRGRLTDRELQILHGMSDGQSNMEIGRELGMSQDTVKSHAHRMFPKLGARDRAHAVMVALRNGLLD